MILEYLSNKKLINELFNKALLKLKPPIKLSPSDWAAKNIYIAEGNAKPGLINFKINAPYQIEPLDFLDNPECERLTLQWAAQTGKTQILLCAIGYKIVYKPCNQNTMQPSQNDLNTWLETKFNPMVESTPVLKKLLPEARSNRGINNTRLKTYPGGALMFSWSGSPKTMRGRSAPFISCDEADAYATTKEGHPVNLLWQRAATFGKEKKLLEISTPTIAGQSWIEKAFNAGDQRYFYLSCNKCKKVQTLKWEQVRWKINDAGILKRSSVNYACFACGALWNDKVRRALIRRGSWRATKVFNGHASYHISELYSIFRNLEDIVQSYLDKKEVGDLQSFYNVSLGLPYNEEHILTTKDQLIKRAINYKEELPDDVLIITGGVDMQGDRLECEIVGWCLQERSYSLEYKIFWGDVLYSEVWQKLENYLKKEFVNKKYGTLKISATCVDTGGTSGCTQSAYSFLMNKHKQKIYAIKGVGGWGRPIISAPSKKRTGLNPRPVYLYLIGVDEAKTVINKRLEIEDSNAPGFCFLPANRPPEWFAQLTAEKLIKRYKRGFTVKEWHKIRARNEALDCRVYAYGAFKILNANLIWLAEKRQTNLIENATIKKEAETKGRFTNISRQRKRGGND